MAQTTVAEAVSFAVDGHALKAAILAVAGTRDKTDKYGPRGGINLRCADGQCAVAATDGYRLSVAMLDAPDCRSCEDTFAGRELEGLAKRLGGAVTVTADARQWTFAGAVASDTLATMPDPFPHYAPIIPDALNATTALVDAASWSTALAPIKRQGKTDPALAHLWLRGGGSALTASQCGFENYSRGIGAELVQGPDRTITFDAEYVKAILKAAGALPIRLHVHAENRAARFDVGEHIVHVVMPCLAKDVPAPSHDTAHDAPVIAKAPRTHRVIERAHDAQRERERIAARTPADLPPPVERVLPQGWDILPSHDPYYPRCRSCGTPSEEGDRFCGMCGTPLVPTLPERTMPSGHQTTDAEPGAGQWPGYVPITVKYHGRNPERIYDACPHASDVRGFGDWLKAGRAVRKGEKGIKIVAPVMGQSDGAPKVVSIKPAYVFDVSQTDERTPRAAAA